MAKGMRRVKGRNLYYNNQETAIRDREREIREVWL